MRRAALDALLIHDPVAKCASVAALASAERKIDAAAGITEPAGVELPGRPERPLLVAPARVAGRGVGTKEGRAALVHSLAHIEFNAINLALDIVWRFARMPDDFYVDWTGVAQEEARHFQMLCAHLARLGCAYGDFPAHDGLWEMAEKTKADVLARLALVPRTLEARGLDVSPAIRSKLASVGDQEGAEILDVILRDEIGHVAIGNRWYRWVCADRGLDPIAAHARLVQQHGAPAPRGPFNLEARRAAGFDDAELAELDRGAGESGLPVTAG
ncbi:MAG: ferritin-like domain-containing protein [Gemmatimonadota bacterium]